LASQFFIGTIFNVIDKSYRQVLTLISNSQLLLKLEISDKFRLVTKETATFSSLDQYRRNGSSHDLEILSVNITTLAALRTQTFSLLATHKLLHFILTE
jgi:hypothetical protein